MKKVFILLLMPIAIFMGCSKSNENVDPSIEGDCKVSRITDNYDQTSLRYDDKGRVISSDYKSLEDGGGLLTTNFSYFEDRIEVTVYEDKKLIETYEYQLDKSGRAIQAKGTYIPSASITDYLFTYNNEGNLVKVVTRNEELNLVYDNGNLVARLITGWHIDTDNSFTYSNEVATPYTSFFASIFADFFDVEAFHYPVLYEHGYFGKKSKNQIIKNKYGIYVYEKNADGKISRVKQSRSNGDDINYTIQYQCDK